MEKREERTFNGGISASRDPLLEVALPVLTVLPFFDLVAGEKSPPRLLSCKPPAISPSQPPNEERREKGACLLASHTSFKA